ncbi:MAG: hypothetical protein DWB56_09220 [Candidatus Jettenia sp.]|uniref:Uncharacterized protein n=1 Tax=Candidatus Jettenia caeni TaxID=247490 RepID=I3IRE7_9BACT|nr:hypothetical protein [Candidatus Jettenia sp. AMX1]MBC6929126.1 hypothetical protein [Candidatus Jettenia sp.]NUN23426.1 hypothetical protein [Candidatus Jettenia caeni]KAA0249580.1 MAG: hypothetical protein EDM77_08195 [Candidatus Jettenia sp. AMX1]MCE7880387.1 hypothetical protein [Candidatus Jettenia sp. AMX1]MCQ3927281.1 hypothetical protein [Candidatus Jettenia sp.]
MVKKIVLLLCTVSLISCLYAIQSAHAVFPKLTPEQVQEAIEYGQKNKSLDMVTFSKSWTVSLEKGKGFATLFTPYHNIAYKARKFAVEHREFTNREIQEVLQTGDSLSFSVTVYGDEYDFALHYSAMVYQKDTVIQPEFEFIPEIAEASESWPDSPSYLARLVFKFPMNDIDLNTSIAFVVMVPGGEEVHFHFDLAKIK